VRLVQTMTTTVATMAAVMATAWMMVVMKQMKVATATGWVRRPARCSAAAEQHCRRSTSPRLVP
jgi:hypothetical protein